MAKRKTPDRSDYWKRWYQEHRERERARKREWYLERRDEIIARNSRNQRESRGSAAPTYRVGIKRRYAIVAGRVYFNSRLGFTAAELRAIAREVAEAAANPGARSAKSVSSSVSKPAKCSTGNRVKRRG